MSKLAVQGGTPAVDKSLAAPAWPEVTPEDEQAVVRALRTGDLTSLTRGGAVEQLEADWARLTRTEHCIAVSNGTAALSLALSAIGVSHGDEVLVPALSFIASAVAPLHIFAIPVFVDIDPETFNIDPADLRARITPRTKAIIVVHLHGLPAAMDEIRAIARDHDLQVVEDAAQAHGAHYRDRPTGGLGDIATFSLNVSKNLPTCGEGGLVTTNRAEVAEKVRMLRQFGERLEPGKRRTYTHWSAGWNNKLSAVQAAFTRSQLARFETNNDRRDHNVRRMLERISALPGVVCPSIPADRTHAWHILRFRFHARDAGLDDVTDGAFRMTVQRALRAEGVPLTEYQRIPLPAQPFLQPEARANNNDPWTLFPERNYVYDSMKYPVTCAVIEDSSTIQRSHLHPESGELLDAYASAFEKIFANLDVIHRMARAARYSPPWASHAPEATT